MRKLDLEVPEFERIEINGDVFNINKSDIDILNKSADLQEKCSDLAKMKDKITDNKDNLETIKMTVNEIISFIDEILIPADRNCGDGAVKTISKGRPVGITKAVEWLTAICGEISRENDRYINVKYE